MMSPDARGITGFYCTNNPPLPCPQHNVPSFKAFLYFMPNFNNSTSINRRQTLSTILGILETHILVARSTSTSGDPSQLDMLGVGLNNWAQQSKIVFLISPTK
jgi:hypothetical protein